MADLKALDDNQVKIMIGEKEILIRQLTNLVLDMKRELEQATRGSNEDPA